MGILTNRVDEAFLKLKDGNFADFVKQIAFVSDVNYRFHFDIVMDRIEHNLDLIKSVKVNMKSKVVKSNKNFISINIIEAKK